MKFHKIYGQTNSRQHLSVTRRVSKQQVEPSVEERLSSEELRKLHNNIHFTQQILAKESLDRTLGGVPEDQRENFV